MCLIKANETWRLRVPAMDDAELAENLERAWMDHLYNTPDGSRPYHDWTHYRAITLREARKRGLDLTVTGR